ncbi:hypothetical protein PUN28_003824 [Cardiocondyla obscurior]|uniref:Uncharacterized protein n=1 Tax=Cardiocondyla obscurior TaxID=286306 RepID=A0AAW2GPB0_9HYME
MKKTAAQSSGIRLESREFDEDDFPRGLGKSWKLKKISPMPILIAVTAIALCDLQSTEEASRFKHRTVYEDTSHTFNSRAISLGGRKFPIASLCNYVARERKKKARTGKKPDVKKKWQAGRSSYRRARRHRDVSERFNRQARARKGN